VVNAITPLQIASWIHNRPRALRSVIKGPRSGAERRVVSGGASESTTLAGVALGPSQRTIAAMNRRRFLVGLAGGGAALVGSASAQDLPLMVGLSVDYEDAGRTIARGFIGLSYDRRRCRE
jgi:hypothetical protein